MRHATVLFAVTLVGALALTTFAKAQSAGFALDRFEPSERGSEWFAGDTLDLRGGARPAFGVVGDYGYKPLVFFDQNGTEVRPLIKHQLYLHLGASLVLADRLRLAANLPVAVVDKGDSGTIGGQQFSAPSGTHVGDLRLSADVRLFGEYRSVITGALGASVWVPTGSRAAYTGDGKVRVSPHFGIAGEVAIFDYAARVGFNWRAQDDALAGQSLGNELLFAASAGLRFADGRFLIGPEIYGSTVTKDGLFKKRGTPFEGIIGAHYTFKGGFRIGAGVGPGFTQGYGSPEVRALALLEWMPEIEPPPPPPPPPPSDRDGDGILDKDDACPDEKGVASDDPKKNGCPIRDRDEDGILDPDDACPDEKGVANDDPKKNGCPDRDEDGIIDSEDACPDEKGVASDDPKKNGCPPPKDTDGDGIIDPEDACPNDPGPRSDDPKKNGCPPARIEKGQIRILEQVQFKTGSDVILPASNGILEAVQKIFSDHTEITRVSVEGHTDNRGSAAYNKKLSTRRASSVMRWLVQHGIDTKRLQSAGYGFERPLDTNDTEEGRQTNRRVEFHIIEIDGKPAETDSVKE
jgi:outer membrane protein OmpA-like peptidoglycan-associated protein